MGTLLRIAGVVLIVLMVLGALAIRAWGLWGVVAVVVGLVLLGMALKALGGLVVGKLKTAAFGMFGAKGAVLKDATLQVHSVVPADPPEATDDLDIDDSLDEEGDTVDAVDAVEEGEEKDEDEDEEDEEVDEGPRDWYYVDLTVTPKPSEGPFQLWEPDELSIASPRGCARP
jgi:hypothetical protein